MDLDAELIRLFDLKSESQIVQGGEVFGQGGYLSFRRAVTITKDGAPPLHVFIKCSDVSRTDLGDRKQVSNHFCRTECVFYGLMAPMLDRVIRQYELEPLFPQTFGQKISDKGTMLVMEDMTKLGFSLVSRSSFCIEQAYCVVKSMARLQAAYWIARKSFNHTLDSVLFGTESPFSATLKKSGMDFKPMVQRNAAYVTAKINERVKSAEDATTILDCINKFIEKMTEDFCSCLPSPKDRPAGISHGDLWFSNFMFKGEGEDMTCRLFDWQFWEVGLFGLDLGLLMISSLSTEALQEHVDKIPATFYRTFKDIYESKTGNPAPFTEEAAQDNMLHSNLWALIWVIVASDVIWEADHVDVANMLANMAFIIRTNRVGLPTNTC